MSKKSIAKSIIRNTLGPITMVRQSLGSNLGKGLAEQLRLWRESSYVDVNEIVRQRHLYDLEEKCRKNDRSEVDVRKAYRNVQLTMSLILAALGYCIWQLVAADVDPGSGFLLVVGCISATTAIFASAQHQACIREKMFFSPLELFAYLAAHPVALLPVSLPAGWRLYTHIVSNPSTKKSERKSFVVRKKEND